MSDAPTEPSGPHPGSIILSNNVYLDRGSGFFGFKGDNVQLSIQIRGEKFLLTLGQKGEKIVFKTCTVGFPSEANKKWGNGNGNSYIPENQTLRLIFNTGGVERNIAFATPHDINDFLMKFKDLNDKFPDKFTVHHTSLGVNDVDKLRGIILRSQQHVPPPVKGGGRKKNKTKKKSNKSKKKSKKRRKSKSKKRRKSKSK